MLNKYNKINTKEMALNAVLGLVLYFAIKRLNTEKPVKKKPVLSVGNVVTDAVGEYKATYFKDSEYFGTEKKPEAYVNNWVYLSQILDQIRIGFGSAVLITKGYEKPLDGVIRNGYNNCTEVCIYPKNQKYYDLQNVVTALINSGKISVSKWQMMSNNSIMIRL